MKTQLKKLYQWTQKLMETLISLLCVLLFSSFKGDKYFKQQRKKRKEKDVCTILGNGASLSSYLAASSGENKNVMVINFFANVQQFWTLKPNMYIVLDNILINKADWEYDKEAVKRLYDNLQRVNWALTFFYPSNGDMAVVRQLQKNKNITVVIYNMTPVSGFKCIRNWLYKKSLGMPLPQNISNAAVFCALNSGFKKVYLYGLEHSWLKNFDVDPKSHRIFFNDGHFYQDECIRWLEKGKYCDWLIGIHQVMRSHFMLREYADSIGAKVINKTDASFIEAYEFDEY